MKTTALIAMLALTLGSPLASAYVQSTNSADPNLVEFEAGRKHAELKLAEDCKRRSEGQTGNVQITSNGTTLSKSRSAIVSEGSSSF